MGEVTEGKFFIRSGNEEFRNRQTGVFDKLNLLEEIHCVAISAWKKGDDGQHDDVADDIEGGCINRRTAVGNDEGGKDCSNEPSFKVPVGLPPKRTSRAASPGSCPGYRAHPEKWTKYTLSNVTEASLSEDANSEAAMEFLESRWKASSDYEDGNDSTIAKSGGDEIGSEKAASSTTLGFGKLLMPEYTVGKFSGKPSRPSLKRTKDADASNDDAEGTQAPKVKLSFLNSISQPGKADVTGSGDNLTVEDGDPEAESVHDVDSDSYKKALEADQDQPNNTPFRSIRKRKRNIRQATFDHGGDGVDN